VTELKCEWTGQPEDTQHVSSEVNRGGWIECKADAEVIVRGKVGHALRVCFNQGESPKGRLYVCRSHARQLLQTMFWDKVGLLEEVQQSE